MLISYDRYWEAVYEEEDEDEGILILPSNLLLFFTTEQVKPCAGCAK